MLTGDAFVANWSRDLVFRRSGDSETPCFVDPAFSKHYDYSGLGCAICVFPWFGGYRLFWAKVEFLDLFKAPKIASKRPQMDDFGQGFGWPKGGTHES